MSLSPARPCSSNARRCGDDRHAVGGEQRLCPPVDHRHDGIVAVAKRRAHDADEGGHEQRRVDSACKRDLGSALESLQTGEQRRERPTVRDGVVDDDRIDRRQLLPWGPHDENRPAADAVSHDLDGMGDSRQPMPIEQRLRPPHPARPAAGEYERAGTHVSPSGCRGPGRAGTRTGP